MHTPPLFADLLIILAASLPVAFLCLRLRLPLLVGLMLTGILIGRDGFGLIKELEAIEVLAEIGVMLLLFTIGLEFSLKRLREMQRLVLFGGGLQVGLTIASTAVIAVLFGREIKQAIFFGFLVALSSTAIVLKSYAERNEIDAPHGRAGVGILLFQDFSIVFMMLLIPVLGGKDEISVGGILTSIGVSIGALVLIVAASWFIVPVMLKYVVRLRSPEVLLLTAVLITLGTAWITSQFGLSLALGAFIAGIVLSESDYSHQITADFLPFRDVFNSIFFVSIGLLLSFGSLLENLSAVVFWVVFLVVGKILIVWAVVLMLGFPQRVAAMTALGLAQIGEFSFVIAKTGKNFDLLKDSDYQIFLASSIITMIATPFLISFAPKFGEILQGVFRDKKNTDVETEDAKTTETTANSDLTNHVIIVGYGLNGRNLARVLRAVRVPYTVLELNAQTVKRAKEKGEKINFGDATRREVLHHARISQANALVLAMSDPQGARRTVKQAREMNPNLYIVVRTRYKSEITELLEIGADEVIPEDFETSIEIFARVLQHYGVTRNVIETQIRQIRNQGYEMLRTSAVISEITPADINAALKSAATETVKLDNLSPVVGKTLSETNLRGVTGATLIAVVRNSKTEINPAPDFCLSADDTLVLLGTNSELKTARKILQAKSETGRFNP